jgi:hypothetical protein
VITVDKILGNYSEVFTGTNLGTFTTAAFWDAASFAKDEGATAVGSALTTNPALVPQQYGMYATFTANGFFVPNVSGGFTFTATGGQFNLFIDPDNNSTKALGMQRALIRSRSVATLMTIRSHQLSSSPVRAMALLVESELPTATSTWCFRPSRLRPLARRSSLRRTPSTLLLM